MPLNDKRVAGAWIIHHTRKLDQVTTNPDYDNMHCAGKAGRLLSSLSGSDESKLSNEQVSALARAAGINALELNSIKQTLHDRALIDNSKNGVAVLGLTAHAVLEHTANLHVDIGATVQENAAILLAEKTSEQPRKKTEISQEISDTFKMSKLQMVDFLESAEQVGFIDVDSSTGNEFYFNGNLFRRDEVNKAQRVLSSLTPVEETRIIELDGKLNVVPCVTADEARRILTNDLYDKCVSVGLYDVTVLGNDSGNIGYVSKPAAFSKYGTALIDDALDLAKSFITSLTYGMTKSTQSRGHITHIELLLKNLINGQWVGPVSAIGHDYQALELKGVVEVKSFSRNGRYGPNLKLLKKEVGELALQAIKTGNISAEAALIIPGSNIVTVHEPERQREKMRKKKMTQPTKKSIGEMLNALRTGR